MDACAGIVTMMKVGNHTKNLNVHGGIKRGRGERGRPIQIL